jgi:aldose 1-epimerase
MLKLSYRSPSGEEGYPGTVDVAVTYQLHVRGEFGVEIAASTDAPTPVNVVHHAYWNLGGHGSGSTLDHLLQLDASHYTIADAALIPTGEIVAVRGTPYDFTHPKTIGTGVAALRAAGGTAQSYDTNYVLDGRDASGDDPIHAARVVCKTSGITLDLHTTMPGVQFYAGHRLDGIRGKGGAVYGRHGGFCLETQYFPDAVNKRGLAGWPDPVLRPGATYRHRMLHCFGLESSRVP